MNITSFYYHPQVNKRAAAAAIIVDVSDYRGIDEKRKVTIDQIKEFQTYLSKLDSNNTHDTIAK